MASDPRVLSVGKYTINMALIFKSCSEFQDFIFQLHEIESVPQNDQVCCLSDVLPEHLPLREMSAWCIDVLPQPLPSKGDVSLMYRWIEMHTSY